jgi:hypothetical protein
MKKIILTESDLHRIIKETVNKVLKEDAYDMNSPEYKQMYDKGKDWDGIKKAEDLKMAKEIEDYESLPEKARHPNTEIRTDRVMSRRDKTFGDKLASKKPNSMFQAIAAKRQKEMERREEHKKAEEIRRFLYFHYMINGINVNVDELSDYEVLRQYNNYLLDNKDKELWYDDYNERMRMPLDTPNHIVG